jgi:hypothetical protein
MPVRHRTPSDYCGQCGEDVPVGAAFCLHCGRNFSNPLPVEAVVAAVPPAPPRRAHLLRWWPAYLIGIFFVFAAIGANGHGPSTGVGQGSSIARTAPAPSPSEQWSNANDAFQRVNNQLIAAQANAVPDADLFAAIDQQAQAVAAQYDALPSAPGVDDSISNQVRDATNYWAKGVHLIATGVSAEDVGTINEGNADLLAAASQIIAADNRLKAALATQH